jgi:hypothetical protein
MNTSSPGSSGIAAIPPFTAQQAFSIAALLSYCARYFGLDVGVSIIQ